MFAKVKLELQAVTQTNMGKFGRPLVTFELRGSLKGHKDIMH